MRCATETLPNELDGRRRRRRAYVVLRLVATVLVVGAWAASSIGADRPVEFARDVRPILSDNCFHCHGPDDAERQADLRLDNWQGDGHVQGLANVVTARQPAESVLLERVESADPGTRMPPPDSEKSLTEEQVETLREWIAAGGEYQAHWSFVPPTRPAKPSVADLDWGRNPIDDFVLARLDQEGLAPSPEADPHALLRRMSLDLIGLPPTGNELDDFVQAYRQDPEAAYRNELERLLASPHYGERWGRLWLDAARYADSDGYEKDKPREVWMYRDWVIRAFNRDMPYDQFVVEQIAGDLLPSPTQDQMVATGFLRNSMINEEGGIDPEQFRMEAMYDRMDAIGKAVLGLTVQCAQCHSHKYDPLTHTEYYRMLAFLNNCHEGQVAVYTDAQREEWELTEAVIRRIEHRMREERPGWREEMAAWEANLPGAAGCWKVVRPQLDASGGQKHILQEDGSILAAGYAPTKHTTVFPVEIRGETIRAVRIELLNDPNLPHGGPGRSPFGLCALTEFNATAAPLDQPDQRVELKIQAATADVNPSRQPLHAIFDDRSDQHRVTGPAAMAIDGDDTTAWGTDIGAGRSNVPHEIVFELAEPLDCEPGMLVTFKLVQNHGGWNSDDNQNNNLGRFRFSVASADDARANPLPHAVRDVLAIPAAQRNEHQDQVVFEYWRTTVADWNAENERLEALWKSHPRGTTQLVLMERDQHRKTHRLQRGDFLAPAEQVTPGVPAFLHPLGAATAESEAEPGRLAFSKWLVDRRSPTTARSIVNRVWQAYFGAGLVTTPGDFGTQGAPPTHPQLLDWLAVELMDNRWSMKHLHRRIVNSSTYRQSSAVSPQKLSRDPANELLGRGARFRLDAEIVRDVALASSGLLNRAQFGPSVYPPAPGFLFQPPSSYGPKSWDEDQGQDRYRRAIYTFRYRSVPHPALTNFDAPNGEISCIRRSQSNTPLQALTTLNEPLFLECARALGRRIVAEGGREDHEKIAYAVERCLSRQPEDAETRTLQEFLDQQRQRFGRDGADPWTMIGDRQADSPSPAAQSDPAAAAELAAWTALARVVLNLDETISRE